MSQERRLKHHPVLNPSAADRPRVTIFVDGRPLEVLKGENLAAALWVHGVWGLHRRDGGELRRGLYCGIGHCYECRVGVDGAADVRSCQIQVREGMRVSLRDPESESDHER